ncbi:MAG: hypothetical protein ABI895_33150 [Deltaproteobacteria bacterium]
MSRVVMSGRATSRVVLVSGLRPVLFRLCRVLQPAAAAFVIGACSSAPPPPPAPPGGLATSAESAPEPPTCVDAKDQRVQCMADSDCCPRFVCGKDPELSQSVTYCVFGG